MNDIAIVILIGIWIFVMVSGTIAYLGWRKVKIGEDTHPLTVKPDLTPEDLKEFDEWCAYGIKNYPNFPVGRTDKLSPNIVAQFIQHKLCVSYDDALNSEYHFTLPKWEDQIRKYWIEEYHS